MDESLPLEKFEGVYFKYDNGFFKFQPQNYKYTNFCPKHEHFSFTMKLRILKNLRLLISKMTTVFSISDLTIAKYHILCEKSKVSFNWKLELKPELN